MTKYYLGGQRVRIANRERRAAAHVHVAPSAVLGLSRVLGIRRSKSKEQAVEEVETTGIADPESTSAVEATAATAAAGATGTVTTTSAEAEGAAAPSERVAPATEAVVSVPSTPAPTLRGDPIGWMRGHPIQIGMVAVFFVVMLQRLIGNKKPKLSTLPAAPDAKVVVKPPGTKTTLRSRKATPKKHESNEEAMDLIGNASRKYIIVGGKGGVGKTSMSAAVATKFADQGQTTLIVSTDPAHSLSDAFDQSVSGGEPVPVSGIDNLYAQEVNPDNMQRSFRLMSEGAKEDAMAGLGDIGLDDLNSLFETIPPGFDEAVALVEIVKYIEGDAAYSKFDRIIFDTAPTGHTLRLLALPDFLNGFFGKIISMKSKFGNMMSQFKGMFGGQDPNADLDSSMNDMEEMKRSMAIVRDLFRDEIQTEFIVATIPNMMAICESTRLIEELRKEQIPVRHVFVNQLQPQNDDCTFCSARHKEHAANLRYINSQFHGLRIATVQCFDREIRGISALRAMGGQLFPAGEAEGSNQSSESQAASLPKTGSDGDASPAGVVPSDHAPKATAAAEVTE